MKTKDGVTFKEMLENVEKQTGRRPKELDGPCDFPEPLAYIWSAFLVLSARRTAGLSGPNPIPYSEIESWLRLTGNQLKPWEVEAIIIVDNIYLRATTDE